MESTQPEPGHGRRPETGHGPRPERGHGPRPERGHALVPETGQVPSPVESGERLPLLPGFREMAMRRMSEERRRLIAELVEQRQSARLSQTQVAARMGTSQSAVARLEAGLGDVRASTLERYAAAVGCQITWRLRD